MQINASSMQRQKQLWTLRFLCAKLQVINLILFRFIYQKKIIVPETLIFMNVSVIPDIMEMASFVPQKEIVIISHLCVIKMQTVNQQLQDGNVFVDKVR